MKNTKIYIRLKAKPGSIIPENAKHLLVNEIENPGFQEAYYAGDLETTTDYIITTDTGKNYDPKALYTTWFVGESGEIEKTLNYTKNALHQTILALKRGLPIPVDLGPKKPIKKTPEVIVAPVEVASEIAQEVAPESAPEPVVSKQIEKFVKKTITKSTPTAKSVTSKAKGKAKPAAKKTNDLSALKETLEMA